MDSTTSSFHSNKIPAWLAKSKSPGSPSCSPNPSTFAIIEAGIGKGVKVRCLMRLPVRRLKNFYVPCKLPVGPRQIAFCVRLSMLFVGIGSSWTSQ